MRHKQNEAGFLTLLACVLVLVACSSDGGRSEQCQEGTCNDHGSCDDSTAVVVCACDTGYAGQYCEQCAASFMDYGDDACRPVDPCINDNDCADQHRECHNNQGVVACGDCLVGYTEVSHGTCQPYDPCAADTRCEVEHRECVNDRGTANCEDCIAGYHAEEDVCVEDRGCEENTCNKHGSCDDSTGVVVCDCLDRYTGNNCERCEDNYTDYGDDICRPTDPCADNSECEVEHRACVNNRGIAECGNCQDGFHEDSGTCLADDTKITVTVIVPASFSATPEKIAASFYTKPAAEGVPTGKGLMIDKPNIGVGIPFVYETTAHQLIGKKILADGTYYMTVVLYVEGGNGNNSIPIPKPGVDWIGTVEQAVVVGGPACDAGSVELHLVP